MASPTARRSSCSVLVLGAVMWLDGCDRRTVAPKAQTGNAAVGGAAGTGTVGSASARKQVQFGKYTVDFEPTPPVAATTTGGASNILASDYTGSDACKQCHEKNHDKWSRHPHRWMNAAATPEAVKGNFSAGAAIRYLGGTASFYRERAGYRMRLERGPVRRVYSIQRTIGSRFFQYYVGRQIEGPEPSGDVQYRMEQVLPFGFWLSERAWVPAVHLIDGTELAEENGFDLDPYRRPLGIEYDSACSQCHTTKVMADWLLVNFANLHEYAVRPITLYAGSYLGELRPELLPGRRPVFPGATDSLLRLYGEIKDRATNLDSTRHAVTLGISCEACHLGARAHVADQHRPPSFLPQGRYVQVATESNRDFGRTRENKNWICSRCHVGTRPEYANGTHTWNSTELTDAKNGSCYSQLTCVHCHDPHQGIGPVWPRTPEEDDAACVSSCHAQYAAAPAIARHTRHRPGGAGSRCMNCHMPKINEGLEEMVRTHRITSPTDGSMITGGNPNACNLCHLDRPIAWTLDRLEEWYGKTYARDLLPYSYPDHEGPVGLSWLGTRFAPTRMSAAVALAKARARWALPALIDMLDDPSLLNRQFTQKWIEPMLGQKLERFGYRFYMTPEERKRPLARLRAKFGSARRPTGS